ncbi:hypothetical protein PDG61_15510 [Mycolicibacterium sp. BiH015]|uniref:hypothetical protein n=1 Tax=Mycolicibacterium sp. BiH015 TaxID=3018808 RepID=UPI0022E86412|nr:hypothetical protein [Mycolicibacterium sp. BiH015]MDA2892327.1 hypothetical protein [Mycolicibacterium sp. BiH015]
MAHAHEPDSSDAWEVVVATLYDRGDPDKGAEERSVVRGSEEEARRVYADTTAVATDEGYAFVTLRNGSSDVESWPQETGWTV